MTDRRRAEVIEQAQRAVDAGIDLIQIRERDLEGRALASLVTRVVSLTRGQATRVVVNDRLDIALACDADGVHLRADSVSVAAARQLAPAGFLIGRSVHAPDDVAACAGADYLIAGTVFSTASKPGDTPWLGLDGLRAIVSAAASPVLAIGGIRTEHFASLAAAGAAGVAAISLFAGQSLPSIVALARGVFDSPQAHP